MGKVYWNNKEIPIPEGAFINKYDGRVFINLDPSVTTRESKKLKIGQATSMTTMHPNDNFRQRYPELWKEYYGDKDNNSYELLTGLYAATLAIVHNNGLYEILVDTYGPLYADAILDYAMYSIAESSDVTMKIDSKMSNRAIFSKELHSDSWYSEMFEDISKDSNKNGLFRSKWMDNCNKDGQTHAWIGIDGSNNDCSIKDCDLAERGHDKSGNNGEIVGYMYAVNTETGLPITYTSFNGGKVDSKAFREMITLLSSHNIGIDGLIIDRGFCTTDVVDALNSLGYPYILMLTSDTKGYEAMMDKYANKIKWNVEHLITEKALIGISDKVKIFKTSKEETTVGFFFDCINGSERATTLMGKVFREVERLRALIKENEGREKKKIVEVKTGLGKYITIKGDEVIVNFKAWQEAVDSKGFSAIASSLELSAKEINRIYHLRDASEKQYMIMKSQLGFSVYRVHDRPRVESKQMAVFVASIIRSEMQSICDSLDLDLSRLLLELDRVKFIYNFNNHTYTAILDMSERVKNFFARLNLIPTDLDIIASEINNRSSSISSLVRPMPVRTVVRNKGGRPRKERPAIDPNTPKRGPGRPKGSKNKVQKPKVKKEKIEEKRKPGRPKGSKDKAPRKPKSK